MSDWKKRAKILSDVVFFPYVTGQVEKEFLEVFVWDLDRTYLETKWQSVSDLWHAATERGFQKHNVPGTHSLVQAIKRSWKDLRGGKNFPIYFITASPPQMEPRISEKLQLDGIHPLGAFYKDNLKNLRPGRFRRLTQQVGFKIQALMQLRTRLHDDVRQTLWGDDSESDAVIYSLYADICSRRLQDQGLRNILEALHVTGVQTEIIMDLQQQVPPKDPVHKIYINLAVDTDPEYYAKFGRRVLPTANSFQTALDLFQDHRLGIEEVIQVSQDMLMNYDFTIDELEQGLDDLVRRQVLMDETVQVIVPKLKQHRLLNPDYAPSISPISAAAEIQEPWVASHIDYLHDSR